MFGFWPPWFGLRVRVSGFGFQVLAAICSGSGRRTLGSGEKPEHFPAGQQRQEKSSATIPH